jgi:ribosomal protein S18 acetylase RimI-like enzyme
VGSSFVMNILEASTERDLGVAAILFREYADWLKVDLCFQGFAAELAGLPGVYAPPQGRLLLAWAGEVPAGCVALRPRSETAGELKRLFVRPAYRRHGLGRKLVERVMVEARGIGYGSIVLDTLSSMHPALRLYEGLGFVRRDAYYDTPLPDTVFMERRL